MHWETVWEFNTARFIVKLAVTNETDNPADHFEREDDIAFAQESGWHWFAARVTVSFRDDENPKQWAITRERPLGEDYLGGCSYHNLEDFKRGGYFRDMVRSAISEARGSINRITSAVKG